MVTERDRERLVRLIAEHAAWAYERTGSFALCACSLCIAAARTLDGARHG